MSRSRLKNKYMRRKHRADGRNEHRLDEMPKNGPSKYISARCEAGKVRWLQEAGSFGGHSVRSQGHRMVSGIVRQKVKAEVRKEISDSIPRHMATFRRTL